MKRVTVTARVDFGDVDVEVTVSAPRLESAPNSRVDPIVADHTQASVLLNAVVVGLDTALRATPPGE